MNRDDTTTDQRAPASARTTPVVGVAVLFENRRPALRVAPIGSQPVTVGRGTAADLFVDDPILSRLHCDLAFDRGVWTIVDRSRYGCFVDGHRIQERFSAASFGLLRIGESVLTTEGDIAELLGERVEKRDGMIFGPKLRVVERQIVAASRAGGDLLVTGESGTGKEWAALRFHEAGPRPKGPRVNVNCATLPENLFESELFGYAKGAFSGADRDRPGLFEAANGGTLFLDEVGELPLSLQPKLLRVLQERAVRRVGEARERPIDVRVVAATNVDLDGARTSGRFRSDLFFRLGQAAVVMPPLRTRKEDVAFLVAGELEKRGAAPPSAALIEAMLLRDWPGNVRELLAAAATAARAASPNDSAIGPRHLPPGALRRPSQSASSPGSPAEIVSDELSAEAIRAALDASDGNVSAAAQALGIHRNTLHRHITRLGLRL